MPFLSPAKLLVVLVVAVMVLGPEKLPKVAKQIGGLWGDFRKFREKLETEVRGSFPDLPPTDAIAQAVRSPLSFLESLTDTPSPESQAEAEGSVAAASDAKVQEQASSGGTRPVGNAPTGEESVVGSLGTDAPIHRVRSTAEDVPQVPGMN